jgi:hypothetical protein
MLRVFKYYVLKSVKNLRKIRNSGWDPIDTKYRVGIELV